MSETHTTSGIQVTEYDEPDTEDITIESDPAADAWERLADVYADGTGCGGCMWHEGGLNPYTGQRWRECHCFDPNACPVLNPRAVANALKRQAS